MKKKGQFKTNPGGDAALLVLIIGVIIIVYILAIPPEERDLLLGINKTNTTINPENLPDNVLLKEVPGSLLEESSNEIEHKFPTVSLLTRTEAAIIAEKESLYTRNSVFSQKTDYIDFKHSTKNENTQLSFNLIESTGKLNIYLNGKLIHTATDKGNIGPLNLQNLQSENRLYFESESPNFKFWKINKHYITGIQITADVKDDSGSRAEYTFVISDSEKAKVESGRLTVMCSEGKKGLLKIQLNYNEIYSAIPDCSAYIRQDLSKELFQTGINRIIYETTGSYTIRNSYITNYLEKPIYPIYYFQVEKEKFENIEDKKTKAILTLKFFEDDERKIGEITINGIITRFDQRDKTYEKDISEYLKEGSNALQITPSTPLDIVELLLEIKNK